MGSERHRQPNRWTALLRGFARDRTSPGAQERKAILDGGLFDAAHYLSLYGDVARAGRDPLDHYLADGWREGRNPSPFFHTEFYLRENPDVQESGVCPLVHYATIGRAEGRAGRPPLRSPRVSKPAVALPSGDFEFPGSVAVVVQLSSSLATPQLLNAAALVPNATLLVAAHGPEALNTARAWSAQRKEIRVEVRESSSAGLHTGYSDTFGADLLREYDCFLYLHDVPVDGTGLSPEGLRSHNLAQLVGHGDQAGRVLRAIALNPKIGLITPKPHSKAFYRSFAPLRETPPSSLAPIAEGYGDFPLGSFFWARSDAVKQALRATAPLTERVLVPLAQRNGFTWGEVDAGTHLMTIGWSDRNFWQYREVATSECLKASIEECRVASFDLFDTLLTRTVLWPAQIFRFVESTLDAKHGMQTGFAGKRIEGDRAARTANHGCHPTLDKIYKQLEATGFAHTAEAAHLELEIEARFAIPRPPIAAGLKYAKEIGKRTILVCDTCYDSSHITALLKRFGIDSFDAVFLSSEIGEDKASGGLWREVGARETIDAGFLHVGYHELDDVRQVLDRGGKAFHVMSPFNLFMNSDLAELLGPNVEEFDLAIGLTVAEVFGAL